MALIAGAITAIMLTGCGTGGTAKTATSSPGPGRQAAGPCARQPPKPGSAAAVVPGTTWPERRVRSPAGATLTFSGLAVDPATDAAYALVPRSLSPVRGPYRLTCIALPSGLVRKGPTLRATALTLACGYLWATGQPGREPVIIQIDPRSLRVVRSIRLPGAAAREYAGMHVAAGPGHSVWAGSALTGRADTLYRLDTRSGRVVATARLPAGTAAYDLASDPSRGVLYASAARIVGGGPEGNLVLEYSVRSGRLIATADHGLVTYSVAGSALTAVPDGVWVSFRTGMLGLTLHMRQAGLTLKAPPGPGVARSAPASLFHWAMYASTAYGGRSLWLANQAGFLACLDPGSGRARAVERLSQRNLVFQLFAADPARHRVYGTDGKGLIVITPPAACWAR